MENQSERSLQSVKNEYKVERRKKRGRWLNLLIVNVGICLAVSTAVFLIRTILGDEVVTASTVDTFFNFINV